MGGKPRKDADIREAKAAVWRCCSEVSALTNPGLPPRKYTLGNTLRKETSPELSILEESGTPTLPSLLRSVDGSSSFSAAALGCVMSH